MISYRTIVFVPALLVLALFSPFAIGGGGSCSSVASGNWSEPTTWDCGGGLGPPGSSDFVTISSGTTVLLDTDVVVNQLSVDIGGDLDVGASASGFSLEWDENGGDLSNANIDLFGDLTIQVSRSRDWVLGNVDGAFSLTLNGAGEASLNGDIGSVTPLNILTTNANGSIVLSGNVYTSSTHTFNNPVSITSDTIFSGSTPSFAQGLDADGNSITFIYTDTFIFPSSVSPLVNVQNLTVGEAPNRGGSPLTQINGDIVTTGSQNYIAPVVLLADVALTSSGNGDIMMRAVDGAQTLVIVTGGLTQFRGNVGNQTRLNRLVTDIAGGNLFTNGSDFFRFDGGQSTVFGGNTQLSASTTVTVDQLGSGNIVFDGALSRTSGSPHRLTINDVSGQTIFNDTVNLGQLTTNDGSGADRVLINASSIATSQGGANNGNMTFNDPVTINTAVTFSETGNGRIDFNSSLNGEGIRGIGLDVIIESDNTVTLGPVGDQFPLESLTTDAGGSTVLNGDVSASSRISFGDAVVVANDLALAVTSSDAIAFDAALDDDGNPATGSSVSLNADTGRVFLNDVGATQPLDDLEVGPRGILRGDVTIVETLDMNGQTVLSDDLTITANQIILDGQVTANKGPARGLTINAGSSLDILNSIGLSGSPISYFRSQSSAPINLIAGNAIVTTQDQFYGGPVTLSDFFELDGDTVVFSDTVNLMDQALILNTSAEIGSMAMATISGTGTVDKLGPGGFELASDHTFSGGLVVADGGLSLTGSTAPAAPVLVFSGILEGDGAAPGQVAISGGELSPGLSPGQFSAGDLTFDNSALLSIELDGLVPGAEHDQVVVTGEVRLDDATLTVSGSYVPNGLGAEIVVIDNDGADAVSNAFTGLAEGQPVQTGNGVLLISYVGGDGNDVSLFDTEAIFADSYETLN